MPDHGPDGYRLGIVRRRTDGSGIREAGKMPDLPQNDMNPEIITREWLAEHNADGDFQMCASLNMRVGLPLFEVIRRMDRADWLIWLLHETRTCNRIQIIWLVCLCARRALRHVLPGEDRPRLSIEAVERAIASDTPETRAAVLAAAGAAKAASEVAMATEDAWAAEAAAEAAWGIARASESDWATDGADWAANAVLDVADAAGGARKTEHRAMCDAIRAELEDEKFKNLA